MPQSGSSTHDAILSEAERLVRSGAFREAAATVEGILSTDPTHQAALYLRAVALRYCGDLTEAEETARYLCTTYPRYGRGAQEWGHSLKSLDRFQEALAAYIRAVQLNPALKASWEAIATLTADEEAKAHAKAEIARLTALPAALVSVESLTAEGKLQKAEDLCRAYLLNNKTDPEGMRLLARLGIETGVLDDAEFLLETAIALKPADKRIRLDYVEVLRRRQKFAAAMAAATTLRTETPDDPAILSAYANAALAAGRDQDAVDVYTDLLRRFPQSAELHLAQGHALKTTGESEGAIAAYRKAASIRPTYGDAYWSLANLKTYEFAEDEIRQMRTAEADPSIALDDRIHMCFALGKALEIRRLTDESFLYYDRGNRLKAEQLGYDPDRLSVELTAQRTFFTETRSASLFGRGIEEAGPIFIVGLPRAGSTLLEQILTAHSQIDGTAELPTIPALAHRLSGRRRRGDPSAYPDILSNLSKEELTDLGRTYLEETKILRTGAPLFTDKMPNNFRHIGLILTILPGAKIIDARRGAMDCCWSGFKQLFAEGQEFSYGLSHIGRYYREYVALMEHWERVAPGRILRIQYEDVVADLEGQVRRLLTYLDLPFEEQCLAFHQSARSVRTASAEQVRQPLYQSGVGQWRPYFDHLSDLFEVLGPELCDARE
ncbi:tetratricopeptide repeat-containing sulfotransferase family protein [Parvularcula bermudensis]|uniref:tetratricopeptide repeat-containing sulfotransferase family protein n=1 Tax=Parvularcula bermudensis TaxID=208216 RepID=UPI0002DAAD57|nr:tetratricopeptide repeat-containing sulfotransferase family protein [Parvularcula bermudensis]